MTLTFGSSSLKERLDKRKDVDLEDILEMHYWEFDLERKNSGERLAFKAKLRYFASWYKEQIKKLTEELETERMRLASCQDVARMVDENIKLRKEVNQLRYQLDVLMGND